MRLWSLDGEELATIRHGRGGNVWSVAFAPDGQRILSTSSDGTARLWPLPLGALLEWADRRVETIRGFRPVEVARYAHLLGEVGVDEPVVPEPEARGYTSSGFNDACWFVVVEPGRTAQEYEEALDQARRAVALRPNDANFRNTLGVACYRAGRHREAVEVLALADEANLASDRPGTRAYDLVFLPCAATGWGRRREPEGSWTRSEYSSRTRPTPSS